jgi:hypothetical protein
MRAVLLPRPQVLDLIDLLKEIEAFKPGERLPAFVLLEVTRLRQQLDDTVADQGEPGDR